MNLWDFARDPSSVLTLLEVGKERAVDEQSLLQGTRLKRAQLDDPNSELSAAQEMRVIANLLKELGHPPSLGLEIGLRCHFTSFGMWGYGLIASASLGAAVDLALRYLHLTFAYCVIENVIRGEEALLTFSPPDLPPGLRRFAVERDMGTAVALLQDLGGPGFRLSQFNLEAGRGRIYSLSERLGSVGGVAPSRSGDRYFLSFPKRFLEHKPPLSNPTTAAMCEQACQRLLERRRAGLQVSELVKVYLEVSTAPTLPSLETISKLTNNSSRTLKRHLQREGHSFRGLVSKGRSELAAQLVLDTTQTLAEVADRLGYSSPSCFSQAFKRWHGLSPSEYRRRAQRSACDFKP